jgi:hypothetical protein
MRSIVLAMSGVAAGLVLAFTLSRGHAESGCPQWEVLLAQPPSILTVQPNEVGKPVVEKAPAGWEPFAYAPSGQLVYRRCGR